jgi:hypothetical protein
MRNLAALLVLAACTSADPVSIDAYPSAVREATCRYLARCGEVESIAACLRINLGLTVQFTASERSAVDMGKIVYDAGNAGACIDALANRECDLTSQSNRFLPDVCRTITAGALHDREACAFDEECLSRTCTVPSCDAACCLGACTGDDPPVRPRVGQSCASVPCDAGSFCDGTTFTCAALRQVGTSCTGPEECQYGLGCPGGTCEPLPELDEPCRDGCRDAGTTCSPTSQTCVRAGLAGAACTLSTVGSDCSAQYPCDTTGHCSGGISLGEACSQGDMCAGDRAVCDVPIGANAGTCALPKPDGAACARNAACESRYCDPFTLVCAPEPVCL